MGSITARDVTKAMCCPTCRRPLREYARTNRTWVLRYELGFDVDAATGVRRRKQATVAFEGSRAEARERLKQLEAKAGTFVKPTTVTVLEFLRRWLETSIKPPA